MNHTQQTISSENEKLEHARRVIQEARIAAREAATIRQFHVDRWTQRKAALRSVSNSWNQW